LEYVALLGQEPHERTEQAFRGQPKLEYELQRQAGGGPLELVSGLRLFDLGHQPKSYVGSSELVVVELMACSLELESSAACESKVAEP
jgi:hypothetical protein